MTASLDGPGDGPEHVRICLDGREILDLVPARGWRCGGKDTMTKTAAGADEPRDWRELADRYTAMHPPLAQPLFARAVEAWAKAEMRVRLLEDWIGSLPAQDAAAAEPGSRAPLDVLMAAYDAAERRRARLGLDPASWAAVRRDMADGDGYEDILGRLARDGKAIREEDPDAGE